VNAIGGAYSKAQKYEYFPVDELHPSFADEPYSLSYVPPPPPLAKLTRSQSPSKQISEIQGTAFARSHPDMSISCFRFHHVVPSKKSMSGDESLLKNAKDLWGWTQSHAAGRACLLAVEAVWTGCEVMYVVGEEHCVPGWDAEALAEVYFPDAVLRKRLAPDEG
jgi:hypothetical protein